MTTPAKSKYKAETKAAVMAALLAGQSVSKVASEYKLPKGTVSGWRKAAKNGGVAQNATQKRIGELLEEYLRANLATLQKQNVVFADVVWLNKQGASELAVLHGVITDKTIRLLEALGGVSSSAS